MSCKVCCFSVDFSSPFRLIRRCSSRIKNRNSSRHSSRKIVLMLVGLDNAGKSSIAKALAKEPVESVVPTMGFSATKLNHRGYAVTLYDLGGSPKIRGIWSNYYVDVHGIMFVVDSSDLNRLGEARKVLEELLAHEKLAGKPLLIFANKQDKEEALDELDFVEQLNVEVLVNLHRCPAMVVMCSVAAPPAGRRFRLDPSIQDGFRWFLRRINNDYNILNARVEQDSAEQLAVIEAARAEWKRTQDTDEEADNPTPNGNLDPFKPIHTLLKENGHVSNGNVVQVEPAPSTGESQWEQTSDDSPDSSSHTVDGKEEGSEGDVRFIPLHSPSPAEPNILVISQPEPSDVVVAAREQFEWKVQKQKNCRLLLRRCNRTAPSSAEHKERVLPPLKTNNCSWAYPRPGTAKSLPSQGWGLGMSLELVQPPSAESLHLEVVHGPRSLASSGDDDNDVVCPQPRPSS